MKMLFLVLLLMVSQLVEVSVAEESVAVRSQFPDVPVISLQALEQAYEEVVIVDTRTRFEYETIHINKAVRVPASSKSFLKLLARYVPDLTTQIAFYCNGGSCSKSFRAATLAIKAGYHNVYSFDAGIFAWAKSNPDRTTLLGETPVSSTKLISEADFAERLISYEQFLQQAADPDAIVVDVRDASQRRNSDGTRNDLPNFPKMDRKHYQVLNLDLFKRRLEQGSYHGEPLLIFDATGKQVKWLQYSLEKIGYENYHFLEGGIFLVTDVVHH